MQQMIDSPFGDDNYEDYEQANYKPQKNPLYAGNPLIEALPYIPKKNELYKKMAIYPKVEKTFRELSDEDRFEFIYTNIKLFFKPNLKHLELARKILRMIRAGYVGRNPIYRAHWRGVEKEKAVKVLKIHVETIQTRPPKIKSLAAGFTLLGLSGTGKSESIKMVLQSIFSSQVIIHHEYHGRKLEIQQVIYLYLETPLDGSLKGLFYNFFLSIDLLLGTNFYYEITRNGKATKDQMVVHVIKFCVMLSIGSIFIDEVQRLPMPVHGAKDKNSETEEVFNFITLLDNELGVPVVFVGTYEAYELFSSDLQQSRRACGQGDMFWERMQNDGIWKQFNKKLWEQQFLRQVTQYSDKWGDVFYELTQGIPDFVVKLYMLVQFRAIILRNTEGDPELITETLIRSVAVDSISFSKDILYAIQTNDLRKLITIKDVKLIDIERAYKNALALLYTKGSEKTADGKIADGNSEMDDDKEEESIPVAKKPAKIKPEPETSPPKTTAPPSPKVKKLKESEMPEDDMRRIVWEGKESGLDTLTSLKNAGLIGDITEFQSFL